MKIHWQPTADPHVDVAEIRGRAFARIKRGSRTSYRYGEREFRSLGYAWVASNLAVDPSVTLGEMEAMR